MDDKNVALHQELWEATRAHGARRSIDPCIRGVAAVAEAVVEAARAALPELGDVDDEAPATPERRAGHVDAGEPGIGPATSRSSSARSAITSLCGDAHAPSWLPRGRDAK